MIEALPLILQALLGLLNVAGANLPQGTATQIIDGLTNLLPAIGKEITTVGPIIQEIVGLVKGTEDVTPEEIAKCDAISASVDAAFDAAAKAAADEDAAAAAAAKPAGS